MLFLGQNGEDNSNNKFSDCINLFNYGFSNFSYKKLYDAGSVYKVVKPSNASSETKELNLVLEDSITVLVENSNYDTELVPTVNLDKLKAPIKKDSIVGTISYDVLRY